MIDTKRLATDAAYWRECGALEGATHYNSDNELFYRVHNECAYVQRADLSWSESAHEAFNVIKSSEFIPRPQAPEAEWVDGLPGVGEEVECWDGEEWLLGQSVGPYLGGWLCMLSRIERPFVGSKGDFRPLRTPEQRQREELTKIIKEAVRLGLNEQGISNMVWAAGWRKAGEE